MIGVFSATAIGGLIGYGAEHIGLTTVGMITAIALGVGGAVIAYMLMMVFGISIWGRTGTSVMGAALALFFGQRQMS